jgi:hypothetical protein
MRSQRNQYLFVEGDQWLPLPLEPASSLGFGRDYYAEVLHNIETGSSLTGLTFYLSKETPQSLPSYGDQVVLLIIGDEHFRLYPYLRDIRAILRCYGDRPRYLDGFPVDGLKRSAFFFFLYKFGEWLSYLWKATKLRPDIISEIRRRTLHVPLGCFGKFEPLPQDISSRSIDYAFLGSIDYRQHPWFSPKSLMKPSKFVARTKMMKALESFSQSRKQWNSKLSVSGGFQDSISKEDDYVKAMSDCKISICPRGSNPETYRFFESCKAGCVVVCEPLPETWFYEHHPGLVIKDWGDLSETLDRLLNETAHLQSLSSASRRFWDSHLSPEAVAARIETFILALECKKS